MAYSVPDLAYPFDALEPHIDARTMEIHHDKHHAAYVTNLNAALEGTEWMDRPIEAVLANLEIIPEDKRTAVRNNGGGHANHTLFWEIMGPNGGGEPIGRPRARRSTTRSARSTSSRRRSTTRASSASAPAGAGSSGTAPASRCSRRRTRTRPSWRARRRSSASTSGSTPTTSTTRTAGPTTSRPGGTSSTGTRSARSSTRRARLGAARVRAVGAARPAPLRAAVRRESGGVRDRIPGVDAAVPFGSTCPRRARVASIRRERADARTDAELIRRVAGGDRPRSRSSTGATRARCSGSRSGGSATAGAPRTSTQDTFASVWRSAAALRPGARRGALVALHRRAERDRRRPPPHAPSRRSTTRPSSPRAGPGPADAPRPSGSRGACIGRSRRSPSSERSLDRARVLERALAERDRRLRRACRSGRSRRGREPRCAVSPTSWRRAAMSSHERRPRDRRRRRRRRTSSSGSSACTRCSAGRAAARAARPRSRARPDPPTAQRDPVPAPVPLHAPPRPRRSPRRRCFGVGYLVGDGPDATRRADGRDVRARARPPSSTCSRRTRRATGRWSSRRRAAAPGTYELWLTRDGELAEPCGAFAVVGEARRPCRSTRRTG